MKFSLEMTKVETADGPATQAEVTVNDNDRGVWVATDLAIEQSCGDKMTAYDMGFRGAIALVNALLKTRR